MKGIYSCRTLIGNWSEDWVAHEVGLVLYSLTETLSPTEDMRGRWEDKEGAEQWNVHAGKAKGVPEEEGGRGSGSAQTGGARVAVVARG